MTALPGGRFGFGLQYRILYNNSKLPGPGGTRFDDTEAYDFFGQRMRVNLEAAANDQVGGFIQGEFRGGWGGSAPAVSDPRGAEPRLNAFNFLDDRGLRYAYLYWKPSKQQQLQAGILPLSDEFGDTLFSADWDWNVGGIAWLSGNDRSRWRAAFLQLVEGVGSRDADVIDRNGTMLAFDFIRAGDTKKDLSFAWGAHAYALVIGEGLPLGGTKEVWLGPSVTVKRDDLTLRLFAILNTGELGRGALAADGTVLGGFTDDDAQDHTGWAFRAEAEKPFGAALLKGQVLWTSGDRAFDDNGSGQGAFIDRRFVTPMGLFGASGYWGYTHIFTANGPSDVNDLGLEIGNQGAGLFTAQVLGRVPLDNRFSLEGVGAWFRAAESRRAERDMGYEFSGMLRARLSGPLYLDAGVASAGLGDFFGRDADRIHEVFLPAAAAILKTSATDPAPVSTVPVPAVDYRRRRRPAMPIRPAPSRASVQGSGISGIADGDSDVSAPLTTWLTSPFEKFSAISASKAATAGVLPVTAMRNRVLLRAERVVTGVLTARSDSPSRGP